MTKRSDTLKTIAGLEKDLSILLADIKYLSDKPKAIFTLNKKKQEFHLLNVELTKLVGDL